MEYYLTIILINILLSFGFIWVSFRIRLVSFWVIRRSPWKCAPFLHVVNNHINEFVKYLTLIIMLIFAITYTHNSYRTEVLTILCCFFRNPVLLIYNSSGLILNGNIGKCRYTSLSRDFIRSRYLVHIVHVCCIKNTWYVLMIYHLLKLGHLNCVCGNIRRGSRGSCFLLLLYTTIFYFPPLKILKIHSSATTPHFCTFIDTENDFSRSPPLVIRIEFSVYSNTGHIYIKIP